MRQSSGRGEWLKINYNEIYVYEFYSEIYQFIY